jgi:hypothetical protein
MDFVAVFGYIGVQGVPAFRANRTSFAGGILTGLEVGAPFFMEHRTMLPAGVAQT